MGLLDSSNTGGPVSPSASTTQTVLPDWYTNYAKDILDAQAGVAAQGYQAYQGPRVAGLNGDSQAAFAATRAAAAGPTGLETANPYFQQAGGMSGVDAATPGLQQAAGYFANSTTPTGINLAQPWLNASGGASVGNIGENMSPYIDSVVNRIGELGNRNLTEKLLPSIGDQFISAGGYGGSRQAEAIGRAIRETQQGISAEQNTALNSGYQSALQAAQADQARRLSIGQTAGQLGTAQQGALATAGQGMAGIGSTLGNLTADQQRILASIGVDVGNLTNADTTTKLSTAGALNQIGVQQQADVQKNYDTAYADFLRQKGYQQEQIDAMTKTATGLKPMIPTAVTEQGYGPAASGTTASPSTLQQIATVLGAIGSFGNG